MKVCPIVMNIHRARNLLAYGTEDAAIQKLVDGGLPSMQAYLAVKAAVTLRTLGS